MKTESLERKAEPIGSEHNDVDRIGEAIAEVAAHINAATHELLTLIREFDARGGWAQQGALSCAHWLTWRIGLDLRAAREKVRVARALADLPELDEALRRGLVSYSKVRAMTRVAKPANESALLELARSSTATQLERICRNFRQALDVERPELAVDQEERRFLRHQSTAGGMVRIEAQLPAEEAAIVMKAIEAARSQLRAPAELCPSKCSAEHSTEAAPANDRADALVLMAESFAAHGATQRTAPERCTVYVHHHECDGAANEPSTLDDGTPLPRETGRRLSCDSSVIEVHESDDTTTQISRRTRTIPTPLRRALQLRDRGCQFPGCTNHLYVDAHHIEHWLDGGETILENLLLLCRRHHRLVHEGAYRVELHQGMTHFVHPQGWVIPDVPALPEVGERVLDRLREQRAAEGIMVDSVETLPWWDGDPVDYGAAIDVLAQYEQLGAQ